MPEKEVSKKPQAERPDQSGLYDLIGGIRSSKNIRGVLSSGEQVAEMVTRLIPEHGYPLNTIRNGTQL